VARHSAAKHVSITLESSGDQICLTIRDDGRGLGKPPSADARQSGRPASLGMIGMRARARSAGGDVTVRSRPDEGVLIEVRVPIRNETNSNPAG
jgi:signal transduction histidine kinase